MWGGGSGNRRGDITSGTPPFRPQLRHHCRYLHLIGATLIARGPRYGAPAGPGGRALSGGRWLGRHGTSATGGPFRPLTGVWRGRSSDSACSSPLCAGVSAAADSRPGRNLARQARGSSGAPGRRGNTPPHGTIP